MKLLKTLRNNWKKSLFAICSLSYGSYYLIERKHTADLLQAYCYEALKYSEEKVNPEKTIKRVTVFLNPNSNDESGKFQYDKFVAPILNLSGLDIRLVRFDKKTQANEYMKQLEINDTDCIVIAGGNATLNECISGLMSRPDSANLLHRIPIGIIPIGATNTFANKWFMKLGLKETNETELRLLADSAMSIIYGNTVPADLMKVSIHQTNSQELTQAEDENNKKGLAYKLLKEDNFYALSNVSAGFVTETDAYLNSYRFYWKLKSHMNKYFMSRHLRRQPIKFSLDYKLKCTGCATCLNETELRTKLTNLIRKKENIKTQISQNNMDNNDSFIKTIFRMFFSVGKFNLKETPEKIENKQREKKYFENLIEKSQIINEKCDKLFETNLIQSEVISNINEPEFRNEVNGIQTVIVKDPEFNPKDMFLADKKSLNEFELVKKNLNEKKIKFKHLEDNMENVFCLEIDGETYKLNNLPESNLKVHVKHIEKCINLIAHDPALTSKIKANYMPRIYFSLKDEIKPTDNDMPTIRPFESLHQKYWTHRF